MSAAYFAKGMEIWKSPVKTKNGDGTISISIGFLCAMATEIVGEEGAKVIAEMLTLTAEADACIASLEAENGQLRMALTNLVAAEDKYFADAGIKLDDPISDAVEAARDVLEAKS